MNKAQLRRPPRQARPRRSLRLVAASTSSGRSSRSATPSSGSGEAETRIAPIGRRRRRTWRRASARSPRSGGHRAGGARARLAPGQGARRRHGQHHAELPRQLADGPAQEFRAGDRAWPGAQILELPDLTSVHLASRIDEADRGQLKAGPDRHDPRRCRARSRRIRRTVSDISMLARVDFSSGWPPAKNFDLKLSIKDADARIKPGMSAVARIAVGTIPDMLLVPAGAVFTAGRPLGRVSPHRPRFDERPGRHRPARRASRSRSRAARAGDRLRPHAYRRKVAKQGQR